MTVPRGMTMRLIHFAIAFALATAGFADTIVLKSGRVINGTYLGGSPRQVKVDIGGHCRTLELSDMARIDFGVASAQSTRGDDRRPAWRRVDNAAPADDPDRPVLRRGDNASNEGNVFRPDANPAPAAPPRDPINLPAGTNLVVRMIDGVDSETAHVGQTYAASLDQPVMLNGETATPRGADVTVNLVDPKDSGKLPGRAERTLDLVSSWGDGKLVAIHTQ